VAVRNSGHYGAAGAYAALAVQQGLIGLATTSTPTPAVVPTFAKEPLLGTNPIALAAPAARNRPFLLDMATSTVSLGKLLERWRSGRRIPRGWALNRRGGPLTNGRAAARYRRLAPLGGDRERGSHKGYGLAVAVEILSAVLPGLASGHSRGGRRARVGHFLLALDPARFRDGFADGLDELIDALHGAEPADPRQPVLVAGDPEQEILAQRSSAGIALSRSVVEDIRAVALACGVPFLLDRARGRASEAERR
jgi:LDH2 family malate/lactate/ureidoglycolate dehydrogenase